MLDKADILKRKRERERESADMNQICWGGCIYIAAVIAVVGYWWFIFFCLNDSFVNTCRGVGGY